jgi:Tfp pilus assembly PilM family ATPase
MPSAAVKREQDNLLAKGIFPQSLELSPLVSLAAMVDYLRYTRSIKPTLVLELGATNTQSYIVSAKGIDAVRPVPVGLEGMVPVVQKELGLKDEESARKLFFSNTFDFTGMGAALCKRLLKELQSSMGFYEVQTGQSITQLVCTVLPTKLSWLENVIGSQLGISVLVPDIKPWLSSKNITLSPSVEALGVDARKFATLGLMIEFSAKLPDASTT